MVTVFEEQCSAVSGGWTAMRYHGDEGDRVADMLSFKSVFEINPFEVGRGHAAERRGYNARKSMVFEALDVADELGVTISFDINYRKNLWEYGADARDTLTRMMQRADIMFGDVLEYEFICQHDPIPFRTPTGEAPDNEAYAKWFEQLHELCPRCGHMIIGVRNQVSPTHHELTALMLADGKMFTSKVQDITPVIDPVGVGDAFAAGSIHAAINFPDDNQRWVDYALAAATLKNRVRGDFPLTTDAEILELVDLGKSYTAEL